MCSRCKGEFRRILVGLGGASVRWSSIFGAYQRRGMQGPRSPGIARTCSAVRCHAQCGNARSRNPLRLIPADRRSMLEPKAGYAAFTRYGGFETSKCRMRSSLHLRTLPCSLTLVEALHGLDHTRAFSSIPRNLLSDPLLVSSQGRALNLHIKVQWPRADSNERPSWRPIRKVPRVHLVDAFKVSGVRSVDGDFEDFVQ